jgi:hypothetical protein
MPKYFLYTDLQTERVLFVTPHRRPLLPSEVVEVTGGSINVFDPENMRIRIVELESKEVFSLLSAVDRFYDTSAKQIRETPARVAT